MSFRKKEKTVFTTEYRLLLNYLREARTAAGLSQRALAEKLGVHYSWVAKTEIGERRLDVVELLQLLLALDVDPNEIIDRLTKSLKKS